MKKDEELVITKDNYKGYFELFTAKQKGKRFVPNEEGLIYVEKITRKMLIISMALVLGLLGFFIPAPLIMIALCVGYAIMSSTYGMIHDVYMYEKLKYKSIQEKYPYVNTKINNRVLTKALAQAKVIERKRYTGDLEFNMNEYDSNIVNYENYLKAEEIKEDYLKETKYKSVSVNSQIPEEELERVKTKVKTLVR